MSHKLIGFIDGENFVLRYQDMLSSGRQPKDDVTHIKNILVWHPDITKQMTADIVRLNFYQTAVGDSLKIGETKNKIRSVEYDFDPDGNLEKNEWRGFLYPKVFKKDKTSSKTKSVDINLTIDMLRHSNDVKFDIILLISGDGDYLPLVDEVTKQGKQVWVAAFSKGLCEDLKYVADEFFDLDTIFFKKV